MEIYTKEEEITTAGMLNFGDVFVSASGTVFMVVNGNPYIKDKSDDFKVLLVDLKEGRIDRIGKNAIVKPIKLVAREE